MMIVKLSLALLTRVFFALQQTPTIPEGFVPVTGAPASEQIPAAPLVIAAYAFFLLLMVFYLWTIWRRISKVEADMQALDRRQSESPKR
jgi:hypothetical protein